MGVVRVLEDVSDLTLEQPAQAIHRLEFDANGGLVVEQCDRVPVKPGLPGDIDNFHLVLAHQSGEVSLDHGVLKNEIASRMTKSS